MTTKRSQAKQNPSVAADLSAELRLLASFPTCQRAEKPQKAPLFPQNGNGNGGRERCRILVICTDRRFAVAVSLQLLGYLFDNHPMGFMVRSSPVCSPAGFSENVCVGVWGVGRVVMSVPLFCPTRQTHYITSLWENPTHSHVA